MACTVDDLYRGSGGGLSLVTTSKSIPEGQGQAGSDGVTRDTFKHHSSEVVTRDTFKHHSGWERTLTEGVVSGFNWLG